MIQKKYFQPVAGKNYINRNNEGTYLCLEARGACSALFISLKSGYMLLAHYCCIFEDGTIEWSFSDGRGFSDVQKAIVTYGLSKKG